VAGQSRTTGDGPVARRQFVSRISRWVLLCFVVSRSRVLLTRLRDCP
jgi:hypothetical protein